MYENSKIARRDVEENEPGSVQEIRARFNRDLTEPASVAVHASSDEDEERGGDDGVLPELGLFF